MSDATVTFFLVRHGEAEGNVKGILCSWPEKHIFHLTETGRKQAAEAARRLASGGVDRIYSSPITRTLETAQAISEATGVGIETDERIRESDFGLYDGGAAVAMTAEYPADTDRIDTDEREIESLRSVRARVEAFLADVLKNDAGKKVVVVSHGDTLEVLYGLLHGQTLEESATGWYPETGSVTEMPGRP